MSAIEDTKSFAVRVKGAVPCDDHTNQTDCETAGCYWYGDACHSDPEPPPEDIPVWVYIIVAVILGYVILSR